MKGSEEMALLESYEQIVVLYHKQMSDGCFSKVSVFDGDRIILFDSIPFERDKVEILWWPHLCCRAGLNNTCITKVAANSSTPSSQFIHLDIWRSHNNVGAFIIAVAIEHET